MSARIISIALTALCVGASTAAFSEIRYSVQFLPEKSRLQVSIDAPVKGSSVAFQIPNWAPGSYRLTNVRDSVQDVLMSNDKNEALDAQHPDPNTWSVPANGAKRVTVRYTIPCQVTGEAIHYSGPSTYMYVVDQKQEPCVLNVTQPSGSMIAVGLDGGPSRFTAPTYDVLADNPVTMGKFEMDTYRYLGKTHYIAMRGPGTPFVDRKYLALACQAVTEMETNFFGGAPYNKYVWHFLVNDNPDGAGGLEHLSSTEITLAGGVGPRAVSVLSHEFFHLWNVKRIRSAPLGPFDYLVLPKTGALWWLEGVTDYYAHLLLFRYGWWNEDAFKNDVLSNTNSARRNAERLNISLYDSSYKVGEASNGRGNSQGLGISYYTFGWLAGMCLDIEIRSQTNGKHSLDDVMMALWNQCKDSKPGFAEDQIRKYCVQFGGEAAGKMYDTCVMTAGEMPLEAQLAKVGLKYGDIEETVPNTGFFYNPSKADKGLIVRRVEDWVGDKIKTGDVIIGWNGKDLQLESNAQLANASDALFEKIKVGVEESYKIRRGSDIIDVKLAPRELKRSRPSLIEIEGCTDAMRQLREGWYRAGKTPTPSALKKGKG